MSKHSMVNMPLFCWFFLDIFSHLYFEIQDSISESTLMEFVTSLHRLDIISKDSYDLMTKLDGLSSVDHTTFFFFLLREEIKDLNKYIMFKVFLKDHDAFSMNSLYYKINFIG